MKIIASLLGLFLFVALLVAACGAATATPQAVMDEVQSSNGQVGADAMIDQDHSGSMKQDSGSMVEADDADGIKGDFDAAMDEKHADTMMEEGSEAAMANEDSESMIEKDSVATMDRDDSGSMVEEGSEGTADKDDAEKMTEKEEAAAMRDLPAWFSAELTDVNSGEVLAVANLQGKVVLVETMAIWCTNCLRQQKEVKALHEALGMRDDLVTLALDIDPNEDADNLKAFAEKQGFSWLYAVAPREVAREIGNLYGDQFLNLPSTPMLIVDKDGDVHLLPFGHKTVHDLQEALGPFLTGGM